MTNGVEHVYSGPATHMVLLQVISTGRLAATVTDADVILTPVVGWAGVYYKLEHAETSHELPASLDPTAVLQMQYLLPPNMDLDKAVANGIKLRAFVRVGRLTPESDPLTISLPYY